MKRAYRKAINERALLRVHSIDKIEFLKAYPSARKQAFRAENVKSAYRAAGLYPPNRNHVLSKLPFNLCTSTPELEEESEEDPQEHTQEEPKTPSKYDQLNELESAVNELLPRVIYGPRSPLKLAFKKLFDLSHTFLQSASVLSQEVTRERTAAMLQKKRRSRPKRQFILESDLSVEEVEGIFSISPEAEECQIDEMSVPANDGSPKRKRRQYSCGRCHTPGHTIKTYPQNLE